MGDLVLYLGGESAIFSGDNGAVACTYNGLAALLAAAGEDLQQCLDVIKALEDSGARFVSLNSLSVAVAQQVNNGQFPGPVRNALLSYLSRSACPLLPTAIDNASPAHMDKLLRAIPDPDKLFTRLALLDAADHSSSSIDDLAAVLADPKIASKFHPESKSSASGMWKAVYIVMNPLTFCIIHFAFYLSHNPFLSPCLPLRRRRRRGCDKCAHVS